MWKHSNVLAMRNIFLAVVLVIAFPMPSTSAESLLFGSSFVFPGDQVIWNRGGEDVGVPGLRFHLRPRNTLDSVMTSGFKQGLCVTCAQDPRHSQFPISGDPLELYSRAAADDDDDPQFTDPISGYFYAQVTGRHPMSFLPEMTDTLTLIFRPWPMAELIEEFGAGTLRGDHMREQCKLTEELRVAKLVDRQSHVKDAIETAESAIASARAVLPRMDLPACGCDDMLLRDYGKDRPRTFSGRFATRWVGGMMGRERVPTSEHPAWKHSTEDDYFVASDSIKLLTDGSHGWVYCEPGDLFLPHRYEEIPRTDNRGGNFPPEEVVGGCVRHAMRDDPITMACMRCGNEAEIRTEKAKLWKDIYDNNERLYAAKTKKLKFDRVWNAIAVLSVGGGATTQLNSTLLSHFEN